MQKNTVANTDLSNNTNRLRARKYVPLHIYCTQLCFTAQSCGTLYFSVLLFAPSLYFPAIHCTNPPTLHCSWWIAEICSRRRNVTKCPMRGCTRRSCHLARMIFIINYLGQGHPDFFLKKIMIFMILMNMKIITILELKIFLCWSFRIQYFIWVRETTTFRREPDNKPPNAETLSQWERKTFLVNRREKLTNTTARQNHLLAAF